jgi:hypothetical protein
MFEAVDLYCERLSAGLWAEPLNAASNVSFFIAGVFAVRLSLARGGLGAAPAALIALLFAIGLGSTLFHTIARTWAVLADVLPILIFQCVFIATYVGAVARTRTRAVVIFVVLFLASQLVFAWLAETGWLNGSLSYAPALLFLLALGGYHWWSGKSAPVSLAAAAGLFLVSLFFRTADAGVCEFIPTGTHFIWHLFNGGVLYLSLLGLLKNIGKTR